MTELNLPGTSYFPSLYSIRQPLIKAEHLTIISQIKVCNKTGEPPENSLDRRKGTVQDLRINLYIKTAAGNCYSELDLLLPAVKRSHFLLGNGEHLVLEKDQELFCFTSSPDQIFDCIISFVTYFEDLKI